MGLLETIFTQYGAWVWWVLGLTLLAFEVLNPFSISIWFGLAALAVGVAALIVDWPWQSQTLVWAAASIVFLVVGRRLFRRDASQSEDPHLNDRGGRLIGRVFTLAEPLGENGGHLTIDDTVWRIRGPLTPAGGRVVIRSLDGTVLVVEPTP